MAELNIPEPSPVALALLKADLGYYGSAIDPSVEQHLKALLAYSLRALAECKIDLNPGEVHDDQLLAMYAAWMYRKRTEGAAKPPMLQQAIRNRQVSSAISCNHQEV